MNRWATVAGAALFLFPATAFAHAYAPGAHTLAYFADPVGGWLRLTGG